MPRLVLLLTSPRVAAGLLSRDAWSTLSAAAAVLARDRDDPTCVALADAGVPIEQVGDLPPTVLARRLLDAAAARPALPAGSDPGAETPDGGPAVVWVGSDDGDPGLADALATEVGRRPEPPEVELLVGSHDVPGSRLLDLVAVMDRLRSPGGCPWDAQQTHVSLVPYLVEEAYEAVEAIESGDREHMAEELGDVLLQVAFHARIGQEDPADPFDIDDVAAGIVAKLVRRHPHVFGPGAGSSAATGQVRTADDVEAGWEAIKAAEKPDRTSVADGIPARLPALARAAKLLTRLDRAGRGELLDGALGAGGTGAELLRLVRDARARGEDAEAELRDVLRTLERLSGSGLP